MKGIIIEGSSRKNGNNSLIAQEIARLTSFPIEHLSEKNIAHFDYDFKNQDDEFLPLLQQIVEGHDLIVFITPVYWYSMSGLMKVFFDRISDCLYIHKETGRKLRGMKMIAISSSEDNRQYDALFMPFRESANYLGMEYLGNIHTWVDSNEVPAVVLDQIQVFLKDCGVTIEVPHSHH